MRWAPTRNESVRLLNTTVDADRRVASATVDRFSFMWVVDEQAWTESRTATISPRDLAIFEDFGDLDDWETSGNVTIEGILDERAVLRSGSFSVPESDDRENVDDDDEQQQEDDDQQGGDEQQEDVEDGGEKGDDGDDDVTDVDGDGRRELIIDVSGPDETSETIIAEVGSGGDISTIDGPTGPSVDLGGSISIGIGGDISTIDPGAVGLSLDGSFVRDGFAGAPRGGSFAGGPRFAVRTYSMPAINFAPSEDTNVSESEMSRTITIKSLDAGSLGVALDAKVQDDDGSVVVKIGPVGGPHRTVFAKRSQGTFSGVVSTSLSSFSTNSLEVLVETRGDAKAEVFDMAGTDSTDGDRLPDSVEIGAKDIRMKYQVFDDSGDIAVEQQQLGLDRTDADTDGDGLPDGEEVKRPLQDGTVPVSSEIVRRTVGQDGAVKVLNFLPFGAPGSTFQNSDNLPVLELYSHPNRPKTDGDGLDDAEENARGSAPRYPEQLAVTITVPTVANRSGFPRQAREVGSPERNVDDMVMVGSKRWATGISGYGDPPACLHPKVNQLAGASKSSGYTCVNATIIIQTRGASLDAPLDIKVDQPRLGQGSKLVAIKDVEADEHFGWDRPNDIVDASIRISQAREYEIILVFKQTVTRQDQDPKDLEDAANLQLKVSFAEESIFSRPSETNQRGELSAEVGYHTEKVTLASGIPDFLTSVHQTYRRGMDRATSAIGKGRTAIGRVTRQVVYKIAQRNYDNPTSADGIVVNSLFMGIRAFAIEAEKINNQLGDWGYVVPIGPSIYITN